MPLEYKDSSKFFILENDLHTQVGISDYGARITHFIVNADDEPIDIVLGFDKLEDYFNAKEHYHGVTVGPFANRIANGRFSLDGKEYRLEQNNGTNCLHSGSVGFHNRFWQVDEFSKSSVTLSINTEEGEDGFPGGLSVQVKYTLDDDNNLSIEYFASTKFASPVNLTNHAYFNLNGENTNDITSHIVEINAEKFLPIDTDCIPTGELRNVDNTPFDFRVPKIVKKDISVEDEQLKIGKGYDHSYVLKEQNDDNFVFAASAVGDVSGIKLEVYTTEPAMQFYTGNYLGSGDKGKGDVVYVDRSGFCFETQHHPDSPNRPEFPSTILRPDDKFYSKTTYRVIL